MKRYVIDEKGRAVNTLHFPYLYTNEEGRGYAFEVPGAVLMKVKNADYEVIVGNTFTAYGGNDPKEANYVCVSNTHPPVTKAMYERKIRWLKRLGAMTEPSKIPAWRYPLVPVK